MSRPLTVGEYRVGITFNPSSNPLVDEIKQAAAHLIDRIEYVKERQAGNEEAIRCAEVAQDEIESAAMWAVKAITKTPQHKTAPVDDAPARS